MQDLISSCKANATTGTEWFLRSFSKVPDDKLDWTPSPTAKSALQIAAHMAVTAGNFARMIRDRRLLPEGQDVPTMVAHLRELEAALTTREDAIRVLRENTDAILAALDSLDDAAVGMEMDSTLGWTMPMTFLMKLPGIHGFVHTGQIDFLQTCWGDMEIYVG